MECHRHAFLLSTGILNDDNWSNVLPTNNTVKTF